VETADHRPRFPPTHHLTHGWIDSRTKESHGTSGPKGPGTYVSRADPDGRAWHRAAGLQHSVDPCFLDAKNYMFAPITQTLLNRLNTHDVFDVGIHSSRNTLLSHIASKAELMHSLMHFLFAFFREAGRRKLNKKSKGSTQEPRFEP
jgi:hypothetical protein